MSINLALILLGVLALSSWSFYRAADATAMRYSNYFSTLAEKAAFVSERKTQACQALGIALQGVREEERVGQRNLLDVLTAEKENSNCQTDLSVNMRLSQYYREVVARIPTGVLDFTRQLAKGAINRFLGALDRDEEVEFRGLLREAVAPSRLTRQDDEAETAEVDLERFDAVVAYTEAIEREPGIPTLYTNRAFAYLARHNPRSAIEDSSAALEMEPGSAWPYFVRARAYILEGGFDAAILDLKKGTELDGATAKLYLPDMALAHAGRGVLLLREGNDVEAMSEFDVARGFDSDVGIEIDRGSAGVFLDRAEKLFEGHRDDDAVIMVKSSLRHDRRASEEIAKSVIAALKDGKDARARAEYEEVVEKEPGVRRSLDREWAKILAARGGKRIASGEESAGAVLFAEALRRDPEVAETIKEERAKAYVRRGMDALNAGKDVEARALFRIAAQNENLSAHDIIKRGVGLLQSDDVGGATAQFEVAKQKQPGTVQAIEYEWATYHVRKGGRLLAKGNYKEARSEFDIALQHNSGVADEIKAAWSGAYIERGRRLIERGREEEAKALLDVLQQQDPNMGAAVASALAGTHQTDQGGKE